MMFSKHDGPLCPWFRSPCKKHGCEMYVSVKGQNPQTGEIIDQWGCTFKFWPMLMIENSQQQRQTSGAVESFRNEMVRANEASQRTMQQAIILAHQPAAPRLIDGTTDPS
jgi:hypothetical protein